MKITEKYLQELIKEELTKVLLVENPRQEVASAYGEIMNLLMGRGEWEKAGGSPGVQEEAYRVLKNSLTKLMQAFRKLPR
jgi:hypothetical protein